MKYFIILLLTIITSSSTAQSSIDCFNRFQHYQTIVGKEDSVIYFMDKLGRMPGEERRFNRMLHAAFAQNFANISQAEADAWTMEGIDPAYKRQFVEDGKRRYAHAQILLARMLEDSSQVVVAGVMPMSYWVKAGKEAGNPRKLVLLMNGYLNKYLSTLPGILTEAYANRLCYAFLMHQFIKNEPSLQRYADSVMAVLGKRTEAAYKRISATGASGMGELITRAELKYLVGYYQLSIARQELKKGNNKAAGAYFKKAAYMSPDVNDQHYADGYEIDMFLLFHDQHESFLPEYLDYLRKYSNGSNADVQAALLDMTMNNINYKTELKKFYTAQNDTAELSFNDYWYAQLNERLKPAPGFALTQLDSTTFDVSKQKGQWALLDFWGTWCEPCREEHPELEKFYKEQGHRIKLLTIACHDRENEVRKYMDEHKYTFPVAMSDRGVEMLYRVIVYPTKVLITPDGKYVVIPSEGDWVKFIREYSEGR